MNILPILRALSRRKVGAVLIALQLALTVAILCNALNVIQQRIRHMQRPSGLDEANIFSFRNEFTGSSNDLSARIQADLAQLRAIPGVVDAAALHSFPLGGYGQATSVALKPDQRDPSAFAAEYLTSARAMQTLGLQLVAGRQFAPDETQEFRAGLDTLDTTTVIVTRALADKLFPDGGALGRNIYIGTPRPGRIIGIVARAQAPWAAQDEGTSIFSKGSEYGIFQPGEFVSSRVAYVVRTQPGRSAALLPVAQRRLYALSRARILSEAQTFKETRAEQYSSDRSLALILTLVCALMLAVAALGVIALTSYWVAQRRRQIGMRRALGASRRDILAYFHIENLMVAGIGGAIGIALGYAGNVWLAANQGIDRINVGYLCVAGVVVLGLSQVAVLWPALRAAALPPAAAIRGQ
jgi:putative ABC transport system permease protein